MRNANHSHSNHGMSPLLGHEIQLLVETWNLRHGVYANKRGTPTPKQTEPRRHEGTKAHEGQSRILFVLLRSFVSSWLRHLFFNRKPVDGEQATEEAGSKVSPARA